MLLPNLLNITDNSSNFSLMENNFQIPSDSFSINEGSEIRPILSDIFELEDIIKNMCVEDIQRMPNITNIFKTTKKRGRGKNKESKKAEHNALSIDNIERKIQIHFLNFIIYFLNDCVLSFFNKQKFTFLKFPYSEKIKVSVEHMKKMKNSTIKDLLENIVISDKYKHFDRDINKMNLKALCEYDWFQQIFKIKYLDLFFDYYNDEHPLKEITKFGIKIILLQKTKSFYYLLQKNKNIEDEIIKYTKDLYISDIKTVNESE